MKSLYEILKEKNCALKDIKNNIGKFVFLTDEEIAKIFEDDNIDSKYKTFIAETCFNRINKLPHKLFINAISYVEDSNILKEKYIEKINKMNYEELVSLIYDSLLSPECLVFLHEIDTIKKHLNNENEIKLRAFYLTTKIHLNENNQKNLILIGKDILSFIIKQKDFPEELEYMIHLYFEAINELINSLELDNPLIEIGIRIMNDSLKKHIIIPEVMIKFYILYRTKELELENYVKNVETPSATNIPGTAAYVRKSKAIEIYYNRIMDLFKNLQSDFQTDTKEDLNDYLNIDILTRISHELGHAIADKKADFIRDNLFLKKKSFYWYNLANEALRASIENEDYFNNHQKFIAENRCDLFSYIDLFMQLETFFKGVFPDKIVEYISKTYVRRIINLYTIRTEKGRKIVSPVEKFINFYNEMLPNSILLSLKIEEEDDIFENLLLGNPIPIEIIKELNKIVTGEVVTTDLHSEINSIILKYHQNNEQLTENPIKK